MIYVLEDMGNLFSDDSGDLLVFDSQHLADPAVTETPPDWEARTRQYSIFVKQTKATADPIKLKILFCRPTVKTKSRGQLQVSLKSDCSLFARLYITLQIRDGDLDAFFKHDNQVFSPDLSQNVSKEGE